MVNFINTYGPSGFKYIRLIVGGGTARMTLLASEVAAVMAAIQGQQIAPGCSLVVQMGASAGRALATADREALRTHIRTNYDAAHKSLNLSALASSHGLQFANFQNASFTTELLNTIHTIAPETVTINLAQNQIQSLSGLTGMMRVLPAMQNLSLSNNYLAG